MSKTRVGVIGAGLMGHGIAYQFAAAGHEVGIFEPSAELRGTLAKRLRSIADLLGDDPACLDLVSAHDQLAPAVRDASFVVEAAPEKLVLKQQIFADLEANVVPARSSPATVRPFHRRRSAVTQAPRARGRHAFLEPTASRASGRGRPDREDERRGDRPQHGFTTSASSRCMCAKTFTASSAIGCSTP